MGKIYFIASMTPKQKICFALFLSFFFISVAAEEVWVCLGGKGRSALCLLFEAKIYSEWTLFIARWKIALTTPLEPRRNAKWFND